ncbi:unnamed protein product [Hymenolepis diminuta]|uniref:Ovule protein n=1 Tax=Hymenolepis diminuta TaxID=6216 RepID=A0A0R3SVS0_HYMDI|nr:unnamed protein product [Hymenolepis diminuta]VUZ53631.1 unnamed protein product [Hymenolepis diminuta]VUZ53632.1 unnamed protein product [Hymenolepis diminuta]
MWKEAKNTKTVKGKFTATSYKVTCKTEDESRSRPIPFKNNQHRDETIWIGAPEHFPQLCYGRPPTESVGNYLPESDCPNANNWRTGEHDWVQNSHSQWNSNGGGVRELGSGEVKTEEKDSNQGDDNEDSRIFKFDEDMDGSWSKSNRCNDKQENKAQLDSVKSRLLGLTCGSEVKSKGDETTKDLWKFTD